MDEPTPQIFREEERLKAIEEELSKVTSNLRMPDPNVDKTLEAELRSIELQAKSARNLHDKAKSQVSKPSNGGGGSNDYKGLGNGIVVAYALIGPPVLGWLIGTFVDKSTNGDQGQTVGVLTGAVAGVFAMIVILYRQKK